jgi:hypothetical protein
MNCLPDSLPSRQASATFRHNPPPTIRCASLASLATIRNNTLALWLTFKAAAVSITQRGNPGAWQHYANSAK